MKIDAALLTAHLRLVSMKGRIQSVVFLKDFAVEVVDSDEEVVLKATSILSFTHTFAVMDLSDFLKIIDSFVGELDFEIRKDGKLIIDSAIGTISYQLADPDTIDTTLKSFTKIQNSQFKDDSFDTTIEVDASFLDSYNRMAKLISPDLVEFFVKGAKLMSKLVSSRGHEAEVEVAKFAEAPSKSTQEKVAACKINADSFKAVLDGILLPGEEKFTMTIDGALRIVYRTYTFIISKQEASA